MTAHRYDGTTAQNAPAPQPRPVTAPAPAAPVRVPVAPVAPASHPGVPAPQARTGAANGHPVAPKADPDTTAADKAAQAVQALHTAPQAPAAPRTTDSAAFARPAAPATAAPRKDATASVAAAQATPGRITARIEDQEDKPAATAPADSKILERPAPQPAPAPAGPVKDWDLPGLPADCAPGRAPKLLTDAQVTARIDYGLTQGWTQRRIGEFAGRSATVVNRRKKERERVA